MADFIGRGFAFPLQLNDRDSFSLVGGDADVRQAIYIIINTAPGERVLRPSYGCEIHSLLFEPANAETASKARRYVEEALERWEPRIELQHIEVTPGATEYGELRIEIRYRLKTEHDPRSMVFPFYLLPDAVEEVEEV